MANGESRVLSGMRLTKRLFTLVLTALIALSSAAAVALAANDRERYGDEANVEDKSFKISRSVHYPGTPQSRDAFVVKRDPADFDPTNRFALDYRCLQISLVGPPPPPSSLCAEAVSECDLVHRLDRFHRQPAIPEGFERSEVLPPLAPCSSAPSTKGGSVDLPALIAREFAVLPVQAPKAHLGPEAGWIAVNMDVVVAAEPATQEFTTTLVGTPVTIRAIPTTYHFDFGDGATITTHFPGKPWPAKHIVSRYQYEGWYELSLTTTFTGEYSINGGPYTPIDGYIEIESPRHWLYSDSLESRLVDGPIDPKKRDIPPRSLDTLGPQRDNPTHTTLKKPARP